MVAFNRPQPTEPQPHDPQPNAMTNKKMDLIADLTADMAIAGALQYQLDHQKELDFNALADRVRKLMCERLLSAMTMCDVISKTLPPRVVAGIFAKSMFDIGYEAASQVASEAA